MKSYIRRSVTLIEIIIVMILIATITGTLAISYRGSLEKGYAFKTEQGMRKIEAILNIFFAENTDQISECENIDWRKVVADSPLVRGDDKSVCRDGWGQDYIVHINRDSNGGVSISVGSKAYDDFKKNKKK